MFSQGEAWGRWESGKSDECESSAKGFGVNKQNVALDLRKLELLQCNVTYLTKCKCVWPAV